MLGIFGRRPCPSSSSQQRQQRQPSLFPFQWPLLSFLSLLLLFSLLLFSQTLSSPSSLQRLCPHLIKSLSSAGDRISDNGSEAGGRIKWNSYGAKGRENNAGIGIDSHRPSSPSSSSSLSSCIPGCDYSVGEWVYDASRAPLYGDDCPFHRNAWNCIRNRHPGVARISRWSWKPLGSKGCSPLPHPFDPAHFLGRIRNHRIGFVGDSLNENFVTALLCTLRAGDPAASKWKKKGAWKGAHFPRFNVTVGYHRAVLLASYHDLQMGAGKRGVHVDVDVPANDWVNITSFYDIYVFNTGHWWGPDKFPPENPLIFYKEGKAIPHLGFKEGMKIVLDHMVSYIERTLPQDSLKIWRMQSPRHFAGGEWNHNGSCLSDKLMTYPQVEEWFGIGKGGINREAREVNAIIDDALKGKDFYVLNVTQLSEYRADAHPALWLGKKDAHLIWGQDCLHWCLPGLPDVWVEILAKVILDYIDLQSAC